MLIRQITKFRFIYLSSLLMTRYNASSGDTIRKKKFIPVLPVLLPARLLSGG